MFTPTVTIALSEYQRTEEQLSQMHRLFHETKDEANQLRDRVAELEKERDGLKAQIACDRFSLATKELADMLRQIQETFQEMLREELRPSQARMDELIRQGQELRPPLDAATFETLMRLKPTETSAE